MNGEETDSEQGETIYVTVVRDEKDTDKGESDGEGSAGEVKSQDEEDSGEDESSPPVSPSISILNYPCGF